VSAQVLIQLNSESLGDNISWIPHAREFQLLHGLDTDVYVTPKWRGLFRDGYPSLRFLDELLTSKNEAQKQGYTHTYNIGVNDSADFIKPNICHATDVLKLPYAEIRPPITVPPNLKNNFDKPYVCIATQSTAQCKYWNNPTGWNQTVDYLQSLEYDAVCIDQHARFGVADHWNDTPANSIRKNRFNKNPEISIPDRINDLYFCDFFIGLGSGLSWLAWALNKPVVLISGFSAPKAEFYTPYRVINESVCNSCWNDPAHTFDKGDWMWCPRHKGTARHFECSKEITFEMVKKQIDRLI
jgi:autotransporter strand-loop-strand O-heptosyltransferase